jgi:hypothetical protein
MCLPLFCLRITVILMNLGIVVLYIQGLGVFVILLSEKLRENEFLDQYDLSYLGIILYSFGIAVVIIGSVGILGTVLKSRCILGMVRSNQYTPILTTAALAIIIISSICIYLADSAIDTLGSEKSCAKNEYFKDANQAVIVADKLLCSRECPCDGDKEFDERMDSKYTDGYAKNVQNCRICDADYKVVGIACEVSESAGFYVDKVFSEDQRKYFDFLKWMEKHFDCAGMCSRSKKYLFSNINRGKPHGSCRGELRDWIDETVKQTSIYILLIGIYLVADIVLVCCIVCSPHKKGSKNSTGVS